MSKHSFLRKIFFGKYLSSLILTQTMIMNSILHSHLQLSTMCGARSLWHPMLKIDNSGGGKIHQFNIFPNSRTQDMGDVSKHLTSSNLSYGFELRRTGIDCGKSCPSPHLLVSVSTHKKPDVTVILPSCCNLSLGHSFSQTYEASSF